MILSLKETGYTSKRTSFCQLHCTNSSVFSAGALSGLRMMFFMLLTNASVLLKRVNVEQTLKQSCVFFFFLNAVNGFGFCAPLFRLSLSLLFPLNIKQTGYLPTYCKVSQHQGFETAA